MRYTRFALLLALAVVTACAGQLPAGQGAAPPAVSGAAPLHSSPTAGARPAALRYLQMTGATHGWAVSDDKVLTTADGGRQWRDVSPPGAHISRLSTVYFRDAQTGWVTIQDPGDHDLVAVAYTRDGGKTWQSTALSVASGSSASFSFWDDRHGWLLVLTGAAMGSQGAELYATDDGGEHWRQLNVAKPYARQELVPSGAIPFAGLKSGLAVQTAQTGWIGVNLRMHSDRPNYTGVYVTRDGGKSWDQQTLPVPAAWNYGTVSTLPPRFFSGGEGVLPAVSGDGNRVLLFYRTTDGGETWQATTALTVGGSGEMAWCFADPLHGWATAGDQLYATADGAKTWTTAAPDRSLQGIRQLQFVSEQDGWALLAHGDATELLRTHDGGRTWQRVDTQGIDGTRP